MSFVFFVLTVSALSVVAAAGAGNVFPALRAIRLLNEGRYIEAENYLRGVVAQAQRPGVRNAARYNLSVSLHRQGRFEESLAQLEMIPLTELDSSLHGAANALYGWNLLFLKRDLDRSEKCIQAAGPLITRATTQFALAYLYLLRGERSRADAILHAVTSKPPDRKSVLGAGQGSALVIDQRFEAIIEEHLLGLCAFERGDQNLAQHHFHKVAMSGHPSFYPRQATEILQRLGYGFPAAA
ncbi:MAG: tetratricopeptide (TPR) repeat protein [Bradymonadia bacterium]